MTWKFFKDTGYTCYKKDLYRYLIESNWYKKRDAKCYTPLESLCQFSENLCLPIQISHAKKLWFYIVGLKDPLKEIIKV